MMPQDMKQHHNEEATKMEHDEESKKKEHGEESKKKEHNEESKKKERHIVTWTQEVFFSVFSCLHLF